MSGAPNALLDALRATVAFKPIGTPAGNLTIGRGKLGDRALHVAVVENRFASGALGGVEGKRLEALLSIALRERSALVVYLDSAGAKVSEGIKALGSFRTLFRAALEARIAGVPLAAVLGRNCYGGASMLAHVASRRLFGPATQLAMSGPSILASAAGVDALDQVYRAVATATLSGASRAKSSPANAVWAEGANLERWLMEALAPPAANALAAFRELHVSLKARLPAAAAPAWAPLVRRDVAKLYPQGHQLRECDGVISGEAPRDGGTERVVGLMSSLPVGAERAWRFADEVWKLVATPPPRVQVLLDCESHAPRLDDEKLVLSEYIAAMSFALAALARAGSRVELTILGRAGGGVYVALAAPVHHIRVEYGAQIQVLPGAAIAAILGEDHADAPKAAEYVQSGVADEEIKLGLAVDI